MRAISISFKKPKSLEGDIIYVWLEKPGSFEGIRATAVSNQSFNYNVRAIAGNIIGNETKEITNTYGIHGNYHNYSDFIKEIAEKNNGDIYYSEAIQQGTNAFRTIRELNNL
jgi:hypothetical protein